MPRRSILLTASILVAAAGTALIALYVSSADDRARARYEQVAAYIAIEDQPAGRSVAELARCGCLRQVQVSREAAATTLDPFTTPAPGLRAVSAIPKGTILEAALFGTGTQTPGDTVDRVMPLMVDAAPRGLKQGSLVTIYRRSGTTVSVVAQRVTLNADPVYNGTAGPATLDLRVTAAQALTLQSGPDREQLTATGELMPRGGSAGLG